MRRQDKFTLIVAAAVVGIVALIISNALFNSPKKRNEKVPTVQSLVTSFPDVKNDSAYNTFFNGNALDPTQTVQIGNTKNNAPFSGQ